MRYLEEHQRAIPAVIDDAHPPLLRSDTVYVLYSSRTSFLIQVKRGRAGRQKGSAGKGDQRPPRHLTELHGRGRKLGQLSVSVGGKVFIKHGWLFDAGPAPRNVATDSLDISVVPPIGRWRIFPRLPMGVEQRGAFRRGAAIATIGFVCRDLIERGRQPRRAIHRSAWPCWLALPFRRPKAFAAIGAWPDQFLSSKGW